MPRELSDAEFAHLMNRKQVADFVESIYNDPQLAPEAKRLIKKKYPTLSIPDFDLESKIDSRFADEDKKRADAEKAAREKEEDALYARQRKEVQDEYGFTEEAMKKLEDLMVERSIGNYKTAAEYMAAKEPKSSEASYDQTRWNFEKRPESAEIAKDPEAWGRNEIMKSLHADAQRAKGRRF